MLKDLSLIIKQTALSIEKFSGSMLYDCIIPEGFKQSVRKIDNSSITYTNHGFIVKSSGLSIYFSNQLWYYAAACTDLYIALSEYDNIIKGSLKIDKEILKSCKDDVHRAESVIPSTYTGQDRNFLVKYLSDYNWWSGGKTVDRNDYYYSPVVSTCKLVNASQSYVAEMTRFLAGKPNERDLLLSIIPQLAKPIKTLIFDKTNVVEFMAYCVKEFLSFDRNMSMVKNFWKINTVTIGFTGCQMGKEKSAQDAVIDQRRLNDCDKSIVWNVDDKQYYFWKEQTTSTLDVFAKQMNSIYENYYCIEITDKYKLYKYALDQQSNANAHFLPNSRIFTPLQTIFYGAPGTGKSHKVKEVTETLPKSDVFRTTFHPDSDYSTFVGCYKPKMVKAPIRDGSGHEITSACEDEKKRIAYEYEPQAFLKAYVRAYETNDPVFLVIEEINRGNCAQIFGDMFQLLDRNEAGESDYAIKPETAIQEFLNEKLKNCDIADEAIKSGEEMRLPANLHIWATMSTSDQSLFPIDSAFKRRWDWKYMPINTRKESWSIKVNGAEYSWSDFLERINAEIDTVTHSEDKKLGLYFCKAENGVISAEKFVSKVLFYIYNDVFKDYGFERDFFKHENGENKGQVITFHNFFKANGDVNEEIVAELLENLKK